MGTNIALGTVLTLAFVEPTAISTDGLTRVLSTLCDAEDPIVTIEHVVFWCTLLVTFLPFISTLLCNNEDTSGAL
jgi:hypothetical protein